MKFVKRYWAPLLAAGLIPLLLVLAILQLSWIREMGERERFRLTQGLFAAADQLSAALENEIGVLPAVFGHDWDDIEETIRRGDWDKFKKRWEIWRSYALDPSFVAGFHLVRAAVGGAPGGTLTWDGERFAADADGNVAEALLRAVRTREDGPSFMAPADLGDGTEAFLLPAGWGSSYWIAIRIDRKALTEGLIPILAERYLFARTDYYFRIIDEKEGRTVYRSDAAADDAFRDGTDVSIPLLRSDFRMVRGDEGPPPAKRSDENAGAVPPNARRRALENAGDVDRKSEAFRSPPPAPLRETASARWTLEALHKKGSLAAAVRMDTVRSGAISLSILLILAVVLFILAEAVRRTQELADRRREFIGTVTHELKTPIAVIRSAADNLADGVVKDLDKTARYGSVIKRESGKLADMIDSLLVYARVGDGAPRMRGSVDLGMIAQSALESRQEELEAEGFEIVVDIADGAQTAVRGDPSALELVVGNLISNAAKHAKAGRFLKLAVGREAPEAGDKAAPKGWAVLTVQDRGPGIPRNERKLVFDPFYRGALARSKQTPGSGLGLNLVGRIVAAHGGRVEVDTQLERGSTFIIRIPLEDTENG